MHTDSKGKKYIVISAVIIGLAFTGITPFIVRYICLAILSKPQAETTGMAIVNITTFLSLLISVVLSVVLAIVGIVKISSAKK